jgi:hypothetical protein
MAEGVELELRDLRRCTRLRCCFFSEDFSMWPLPVGAGNTHSSSAAARRISKMAAVL